MSCQAFSRKRRTLAGFSLVEMLVALAFISILSAGMMRVYASNLSGFQRVNDTIASQRRGRWALSSLQDDVSSIGYFAYVGFNNPAAGNYSLTSGTQEPFMILPGPTAVTVTGPDPTNPAGALLTAKLPTNPDELQYLSDVPLSINASFASLVGGNLIVTVNSGSLADLQAGDIVAIQDAQFEQFMVSGAAGSNVALNTTTTDVANAGGLSYGSVYYFSIPGSKTHIIGAPVAFFRPSVVTRYSIQAMALDPSNNAITIPCLVRQQASYPTGGSLVNWAGVATQVVAENIDGFVVDMSFDGGTTWLRSGSANWDAIVGKITTALAAYGVTGIPARNAASPIWFRTHPFLIRMDVTSRSSNPRTEDSNVAGQAAYLRRTQTLMVTPRNFGFSF